MEFLTQNNAKIWSLKISGPEFTDSLSKNLLQFETVEILELMETRISGKLLESISQMPLLRIIRIKGADVDEFDLSSLPPGLNSVTEFTFRGTPAKVIGGSHLRIAFPGLTNLCFAGRSNTDWDHPPVLTELERLELSFPEQASWMQNIAGTQTVSLNFYSCEEDAIFALLRTGKESLEKVLLRGTPIGNKIFDVLAAIPNLEHFDVVDTKVTNEALLNFNSQRPELSCWPNLK